MKKSRLIIGSLLALFFLFILFYDGDNEYLQEKTANKIWHEFSNKIDTVIHKGDHLTYEPSTNIPNESKWIKYREHFNQQVDMLNVKNSPKMRNVYILETKFEDLDGKYNVGFRLLEKNTKELIDVWNISGEPIRAKSILPALLALVLAILTMRPVLSLFLAVWVGSTLNNANLPIVGIQQLIAKHIPDAVMGDNLFNLKVLLSLLIIQITISLLWRTASTGRLASPFLRLAATPLLSVHPYLFSSMGAWNLNTINFKNEKRYFSPFISQALALVLPSIILTPYIISVLDIVSKQLLMIGVDLKGMTFFLDILVFRFFSLSLLAIIIGILLFSYKKTKTEPYQSCQRNVRTSKTLPLFTILTCSSLLFLSSLRFTDVSTSFLIGTTGALSLSIIVSIKTYLLSWKELLDVVLSSIKNNLGYVSLLVLSFTMVNILSDLGTVYYVVSLFKLNGTATLFPLFAFLISTITTLLMGNSIVTFLFITPVLIPLGGMLGGITGVIMVLAGILEGGLAGELLNPFSPTSIIVSNTYKVSPIKHVLNQAPFVLLGLLYASVLGFFMTNNGIPLWIGYISIFLLGIVSMIKQFSYKRMS